jgi:hypothetical protein
VEGVEAVIDAMAANRDRLMLAVVAGAGAVLVLSIALAFAATSPKPVVLVPGAKVPVEARPGDVPDEAARSFAQLYVLTFDNYTPATVDKAAAALKARVAPRRFTEVADALDRRTKVVVEGRMSSHVVAAGPAEVARPGDGTIAVTVDATRRLFIADKLSKESQVRYRIVLEPCAPTAANPNGLAVVAQGVEERDEARR